MNHQRTNWGMSLWICDIYWGDASLWTSPLASLTRKKQMVRGHGMFGHWNTRVSWCFLCFSAHLFYILFRDYSRPPFVQDVKGVLSKCNSQLRVHHDLLTPTKSLMYRATSLWRELLDTLLSHVLKLLAENCAPFEIPHTKAIHHFWVYTAACFVFLIPLSFSQLVILQHVYFNRVKINEPQWLKEIFKYCVVQFTEQGAPLITFK